MGVCSGSVRGRECFDTVVRSSPVACGEHYAMTPLPFLLPQVEELFRNGADPLTKDKHGRSAGHYAASGGHAEVLEALAVRGVDLDAEDPLGRGPLHYAAAGEGNGRAFCCCPPNLRCTYA